MRLNLLPRDHTRADFDFNWSDGTTGPDRLPAMDLGDRVLPAIVFCARHGWEVEIPDTQSLRRRRRAGTGSEG